MPLPEGYQPKQDDIITVLARVNSSRQRDDERIYITLVGSSHTTAFIPPESVVGLHCRSWEKGDKVVPATLGNVRSQSKGYHAEVRAVEGDKVWVKFPDGEFDTFQANDLVEAPEEPEALVPVAALEPPDYRLVPRDPHDAEF